MDKNVQVDKKILISCPISDREWVLPQYLEKLYSIDYPKKLISFYFIINHSSDKSSDIIKEFKRKYKHEYGHIKIEFYDSRNRFKDDRGSKTRSELTYHWLSELRNKIINECVKRNYDYLFSCDSDILVPSDIIKRLLSHKKDMVASLIYNGYLYTPPKALSTYEPMDNAYKYPNILKGNPYTGYKHIVNYGVKNPNLINEDECLQEVDFTGAVFLATRQVCEVGRYKWHSQGEDEPFCRSIKDKEYNIYCDLSCYSQHMMNEEILRKYLNKELKFTNGDIIEIY